MTIRHTLSRALRRSSWLWAALWMAPPVWAAAAPDCPAPVQAPTQEQAIAGMKAARDHGFLWRISKDGRESYLYGTIHVAKAEWMYPGPSVMKAIIASDTLALEFDMLDPDIQRRLMAAAAAKPDAPVLPDALRQRLAQAAQAECLPPQAMEPLMPELQIATLVGQVSRRDGLETAFGIDIFLAGMGHGMKKNVVSLETPESQVDALRAGSAAELAQQAQGTLDELEAGRVRPLLRRLAQVWVEGDLAQLSQYESWCDCTKTEADRALMRRLLDARNPLMAESIDRLHASGKRVFAAVGSLHMHGPVGLPALLGQRGYRVERVPHFTP